jgi:hypothetical protein
MAVALIPAWHKVCAHITDEPDVSGAETALLLRMTQVFE